MFIGENLGSEAAAIAFNKKISEGMFSKNENGFMMVSRGCVGSIACEKCFHVISGTCLCGGLHKCPNCGDNSGEIFARKLREEIDKIPISNNIGVNFFGLSNISTEDLIIELNKRNLFIQGGLI